MWRFRCAVVTAFLIAALPSLSCVAHFGARALAGSYHFVAVYERTLPFLSTHGDQCDTYLTGATLVMRRDTTYTLSWRDSTACRTLPPPDNPIRTRVYAGRFTLSGRDLTLHVGASEGALAAVITVVRDTLYWGQAAPGFFGFVRTRRERPPAPSN